MFLWTEIQIGFTDLCLSVQMLSRPKMGNSKDFRIAMTVKIRQVNGWLTDACTWDVNIDYLMPYPRVKRRSTTSFLASTASTHPNALPITSRI